MRKNIKYQKGFTLIELLVVVVIIGVLASLLMVNFVGIRQRARDGQRKADLRQIQTALEMYRADQGSYPSSLLACGNSLAFGTTIYMQKIPCDPLLAGSYFYSSNSTVYCVRGCLENANDSEADISSSKYSRNNPIIITGCSTLGSCSSDKRSFTLQNP